MICPSCNKFAAYDTSNEPEAEIEAGEFEPEGKNKDKGTVPLTGSVRIVLSSECCSEEMKEANFDVDIPDVAVSKAADCTCEKAWHEDLSVQTEGFEVTDRRETTKEKTIKRGPDKGKVVKVPIPFRYQRTYYGCSVTIELTCGCGKSVGETVFEDECPASGMDELV